MNGHAHALALAVLIYHDETLQEIAGDTLQTWHRATGSDDCSAVVLCRLARRVLADNQEEGEAAE